ncbi:MAG: nitrate reductase [Bradyrhizobium sp.]|nr:nitrate reductase [Bradyrhizobium sp.]
MALREATSFCRICSSCCGVRLMIDDNEHIVEIRGDKQQPMTLGYACFKGLQAEEAHHGKARLLHPLKRELDGSFVRISAEQALDEIAVKMRTLIDRHGPDTIGLFKGGGAFQTATANAMIGSFLDTIGSSQLFTTLTIDQSAKIVSFERLGGWAAGVQDLKQSEVVLLFGANPLLSHAVVGVMSSDPTRRLKKARARGLKLICVDPRRSETARQADLFLQPIPGQDAAIAAGLLRLILAEGWQDRSFCEENVGADRVAALRMAVEPFTESFVESNAGLETGQLRATATLFARDSRTGGAFTGTGPSMSPFSNLSQHLIDCLNVICGRFRRAGDRLVVSMMSQVTDVHAEVIEAPRSWEGERPSRIRGVGRLGGERLSATLAEEILTSGEGQIRCLFVDGGNPATGMPDQRRMVEALRALDLLVVIDPYMTPTAELADYVFPPLMQYERADLPLVIPGFPLFPENWAQYAPPVLKTPPGSEIVEGWYVYWSIARRLGRTITFLGKTDLDMDVAPDSETLLEILLEGSPLTLDDLKQYPSGKIFEISQNVLPARAGMSAKFDVMPDDVHLELQQFLAAQGEPLQFVSQGKGFTHLLTSRRLRDVMNSIGTQLDAVLARTPYNPAYLNPIELTALGVVDGDLIEIESDYGRITVVARSDDAVRPGVVSIAHGWGSLPDGGSHAGVCVNILTNSTRDVETVNAMPRMSAIPVNLHPLNRQ